MARNSLPKTNRSLPIALIRAREKIMAPIREMLAETGITEQQWRVLRVLSEAPSLDATEVAERASLHQPSLTRILRTLEERDLIKRTQDKADRRRQVVALTGTGQHIIDDNLEEATRIAEAIEATLGSERFETLLDLLSRLDQFRIDRTNPPSKT